MKIHFVGIGGIGISGLAQFCACRGDQISGSNLGESEIFPILRSAGISKLFSAHDAANLPENLDLLVFSEAVPTENCERATARTKKIPEKSYFELLGEISREFCTIAVAGTHGKTTTTGLLASGLLACGADPTALVGSTLREFDRSNFRSGNSNLLLVEACEYRENFRFLRPEIVILTGVDFDHPDYFQDEAHYFSAFKKFVAGAKTVIFHADDRGSVAVLRDFSGKKIAVPRSSNFVNFLKIPGKHNRRNSALALACGRFLGVDFEKFKLGVQNFSGAARRQEFLGEISARGRNFKIFDDYGHHPAEISATLAAFREKFPEKKIALIFEPHQFSRSRIFFKKFVDSLKNADAVGIFPIFAARDSAEDLKFKLENFLDAIAGAKKIENFADASDFLEKSDAEIVIFMGAGRISKFAHDFFSKNKK